MYVALQLTGSFQYDFFPLAFPFMSDAVEGLVKVFRTIRAPELSCLVSMNNFCMFHQCWLSGEMLWAYFSFNFQVICRRTFLQSILAPQCCSRSCLKRLLLCLNLAPQSWQLKFIWLLWILAWWILRLTVDLKFLLHVLHIFGSIFACSASIWYFKPALFVKVLSHSLHWLDLDFSWIVCSCLLLVVGCSNILKHVAHVTLALKAICVNAS